MSHHITWRRQSGAGELLAGTVLHHSHDPYFRARLPWSVGLVRLDSGPTVLVHLPESAPEPPARVWVSARLDRGGEGVLIASARQDGTDLNDDRRLREMTSDPRDAHVLVTDGTSAHAQALVRGLSMAGATRIWVGLPSRRDPVTLPAGLRGIPQVSGLRLDSTDKGSVREAAALLGSEIDILINTAESPGGESASEGYFNLARAEMETHYFGLLNLARYFVPCLSARAASAQQLTPAWVNVLSIFALSSCPPRRTFSAAMAAAHTLTQCMRAQMREAGVRLISVFPGPLENDHSQGLPDPKLSPVAFAKSIVDALRTGLEEVYPGDVAREWLERAR